VLKHLGSIGLAAPWRLIPAPSAEIAPARGFYRRVRQTSALARFYSRHILARALISRRAARPALILTTRNIFKPRALSPQKTPRRQETDATNEPPMTPKELQVPHAADYADCADFFSGQGPTARGGRAHALSFLRHALPLSLTATHSGLPSPHTLVRVSNAKKNMSFYRAGLHQRAAGRPECVQPRQPPVYHAPPTIPHVFPVPVQLRRFACGARWTIHAHLCNVKGNFKNF